MALFRREQTGAGDYLDVAMMDSILACMPNNMGAVFADNKPPVPQEERTWGGNAMYRIYATKDAKHIVLGGSELKFARNLLTKLGREDLIDLCAEPPGRKQRPVVEFFDELFKTRTQAQWVDFFEGLDVCFAPVNDLRAGLNLAQTVHREMCLVDDTGREHLGIPIKYLHEPGCVNFQAPGHGEHTVKLLSSLGYDEAEISQLFAEGVI